MNPRREQILATFAGFGWQFAGHAYAGRADWADQVLELQRQDGQRLFLTLLVDEEWIGNTLQKHGVLALGASPALPTSRAEAEGALLTLENGWEEALESFAAGLSKSRE